MVLHRDAKRQLRPNLWPAPAGSVADGQAPVFLARFQRGFDGRNPNIFLHLRRAVGIADRLEQRCRFRVHAQMLQRALGRVALHVGLPHQQIDFQWLGRSVNGQCGEDQN